MNKGDTTQSADVEIPIALGLADATLVSRNSDRSYRVIDGVMNNIMIAMNRVTPRLIVRKITGFLMR